MNSLAGNKHAFDASQHCFRGLEACLSARVYLRRKAEKVLIVNGVLTQQRVTPNDPERLALISQILSKESQKRALVLGTLDSRRD